MMDHTAFLLPRETPLPAIKPPDGVIPDFIHPESRAHYCIAVHTVVLTIATLFIAMRMYVKLRITRSPGWDDCKSLHCLSVSHKSFSLTDNPTDTILIAWVPLLSFFEMLNSRKSEWDADQVLLDNVNGIFGGWTITYVKGCTLR